MLVDVARVWYKPASSMPGSHKPIWPAWWDWELELTPHVEKRMEDRQFSEVELRGMLHNATGYRPNAVDGRFTIEARLAGRSWEIIVEPDDAEMVLVVITAFPLGAK